MRARILSAIVACIVALANAETHAVDDDYNYRKLIGRELRRGGKSAGGRGRSSFRIRGTKGSYAASYSSPSGTKYSGKSTYYTYMGTLTYYNSYYSRTENCGDYTEHDYCTTKERNNKLSKTFGGLFFCLFCVLCVCGICNYHKIGACCMNCSSCTCCKKERTLFDPVDNQYNFERK